MEFNNIIKTEYIPDELDVFKLPKILRTDPYIIAKASDATHGDLIIFDDKFYVVFDENINIIIED